MVVGGRKVSWDDLIAVGRVVAWLAEIVTWPVLL